jgi:hypothetical protein
MAVVTATFQKCGSFKVKCPWKLVAVSHAVRDQLKTPQQQQESKQEQGCWQ